MADLNNPLTNYNFLLRINGIKDIPCKSVRGFAKEYQFEYIKEGGVNDYVHVKRKQSQEPNIVQVERYVYDDNQIALMLPGFKMLTPMVLLVSRYPGEFSSPQRIYTFTGCVVMKVEYGELSAESGKLLTEIVSIAYEDVICVDNLKAAEKKPWEFDGTKAEGKGKKYARKVADYGIEKKKAAETEKKKTYARKVSDYGVKDKREKESRKWPAVSSRRDISKYL